MDWLTPTNLQGLLVTLAPGFIVLAIRRQFSVYQSRSMQEQFVTYAAVSAAYFAILNPLAELIGFERTSASYNVVSYAMVPAFIGMTWVVLSKFDLFSWFWKKFGLKLIHHIPSAWDYAFAKIQPDTFVVVTLDSGTQIAGKFGANALASTDANERDILLSEVWDLDGDEWKIPPARKSILICGDSVKQIELFHAEEGEVIND